MVSIYDTFTANSNSNSNSNGCICSAPPTISPMAHSIVSGRRLTVKEF